MQFVECFQVSQSAVIISSLLIPHPLVKGPFPVRQSIVFFSFPISSNKITLTRVQLAT